MAAEVNRELPLMEQRTMPSLSGDESANASNFDLAESRRDGSVRLDYGEVEVDDSGFDLDESLYAFETETVPVE